ncbi:signal peptidase I [Salinirarus marinus]|uniref:signal peptidase I n=1 Tax=Salinirarus marinus TaxID=3068310 RepID=UPI003C6C0691
MSPRRALSLGIELLAVALVVSLIAGQVLGYPVLLSYVETGSMEPTLNPGDGFVAVPTAVVDDVEEGDVVVFRAEEIQGGGLTTHRVVRETERGYVTRGDANPFTDQDGGEPPVKDAQIVAEALQLGGGVVVVPNLGTAVMAIQDGISGTQRYIAALVGSRALLGTQGLTYLLLALSALLYVFDLLAGDASDRDRDRTRTRNQGVSTQVILVALAVVLVVAATAAMVVPAGTQKYGIVSAEFDSESPTVVPMGESKTLPYRVSNAGLVPVVVYLEPASQGVAVDRDRLHVGGQATETVELTLSAPDRTGYYRRFLTEHRYLAVLPTPVVDALYRVHPWLPIAVVDALLAGAFYLLGRAVVGTGRLRNRSRDREAAGGFRAIVRRLY